MTTTFKSNTYDGRYLEFKLTQDGQYIDWTLSSKGGSSSYYTIYNLWCVINGTTVYGAEGKDYDWSTKKFPAATGSTSGTIKIGTAAKSVKVKFYGNVYSASSTNRGGTFEFEATYTKCGTPTVTVTDNGNNTFKITATEGSDGTNNPADGVTSVGYSINDGDSWTSTTSGKSISITKNTSVMGRAKTNSSIGSSWDSSYKTTSAKTIKYYSKPGKPNIDFNYDEETGKLSISATVGSNGSNNASASVVNLQYSTNGGTTYTSYSSPISIDSNATVYAKARTKGTYTGNSNAYLYSDYITETYGVVVPPTNCYAPKLQANKYVIDENTDSLELSFSGAISGTNNSIEYYDIQVSYSNTLNFAIWEDLSTTDTTYVTFITADILNLMSSNTKYIGFRVRAVGNAGEKYASDYSTVSIQVNRFKYKLAANDNFEPYIPYIGERYINIASVNHSQTKYSYISGILFPNIDNNLNIFNAKYKLVSNSESSHTQIEDYYMTAYVAGNYVELYLNSSLTNNTSGYIEIELPNNIINILNRINENTNSEYNYYIGLSYDTSSQELTNISIYEKLDEPVWLQIDFASAGVISKLYDENNEEILDISGKPIYTLEYNYQD